MKCYNHPDRDAVGVCTVCGRGVCQDESLSIGGRLYCKADAERLIGTSPTTPLTQQEPVKKTSWKAYAAGGIFFLFVVIFVLAWGGFSADVADAFRMVRIDQCNASPQDMQALPNLVRFTIPTTLKNPSSTPLKVTLTYQIYMGDQLVGSLITRNADLPPSGSYAADMKFTFSGSALNTILQGGSTTMRARGLLSGSGSTSMGTMQFSQTFDASQVMNLKNVGEAPNVSSSQCEYALLGG